METTQLDKSLYHSSLAFWFDVLSACLNLFLNQFKGADFKDNS